jgi:Flp pilus assembly protein TadG
MVLFALAMIVILGMVAVALDGGYGFVQNRRAQNATDFAAFAGARELFGSSLCKLRLAVTNATEEC